MGNNESYDWVCQFSIYLFSSFSSPFFSYIFVILFFLPDPFGSHNAKSFCAEEKIWFMNFPFTISKLIALGVFMKTQMRIYPKTNEGKAKLERIIINIPLLKAFCRLGERLPGREMSFISPKITVGSPDLCSVGRLSKGLGMHGSPSAPLYLPIESAAKWSGISVTTKPSGIHNNDNGFLIIAHKFSGYFLIDWLFYYNLLRMNNWIM